MTIGRWYSPVVTGIMELGRLNLEEVNPAFARMESEKPFRERKKKTVHPTEIRTWISSTSAVELNTTSALTNYATEADDTIRVTDTLNVLELLIYERVCHNALRGVGDVYWTTFLEEVEKYEDRVGGKKLLMLGFSSGNLATGWLERKIIVENTYLSRSLSPSQCLSRSLSPSQCFSRSLSPSQYPNALGTDPGSSWRSETPEDATSPSPSSCATPNSATDVPDSELTFTVGVTESTPYPCQFCDKAFPRLSYLKKHEQVSVSPEGTRAVSGHFHLAGSLESLALYGTWVDNWRI
uniref:C2H2-type domain-containing protein n=1 Tax=Timema tahoe TaxID=61484 RepID=A0A7R9II93_9NEOP|nr:unnamed protein product [Timema tahoe]